MSPDRRPSSPIRFSFCFLVSALLLIPCAAWADKVHLKSGEVITGNIIEETPDIVRIQVLVGTIKDKRTVNRISIDRIEKTTPEDVERESCLPLKNTPDGLPAKGYEERIKVVNDFLEKYPTGKYVAEIQEIRDSLNGEFEKVKAGEIRFRGTWLTPEQQAIHSLNLEASTAHRIMRQAASGRNLLGALRQFELIEKTYPGTLAFPAAIADAKSILPAYGRSLTQELEFAKYQAAENAKGLASLSAAAQAAAQQETAAADARFKAQIAAEKQRKITWLSVDLKSEASINEAIARIRKEIDRIGKLDAAALEEQAKAFYDAGELIYAGKLPEAKLALTSASSIKGGAKLSQAAKAKPSASSTAAAAAAAKPSLLAYLQMQLEDRVEKQANAAKLAELNAAKQAAEASAANNTATTSDAGDDALNALVMQRSASTPADDKAKPSGAAAKSTKPERPTSAAAAKAAAKSPAAGADDEEAAERPKPVRPVAKKKSSPFPLIIGAVTVCLVGATVFLLIQEKKKQGGGDS